MSQVETLERAFPTAVSLPRYVERTRRVLRAHGFTARNSLPLLGACRDELSVGIFTEVNARWGAPFELMTVAGLPTYGRTALGAAAQHIPDSDGPPRMVAILTTHIGIDREGRIGWCGRPGQSEPTTACGALAVFRGELAAGRRDTRFDPSDVEMSLLRARLLPMIPEGEVPAFEDLTRTVRDVIATDFPPALAPVLKGTGTLLAVFTGIVVHGSHGRDWVEPGSAVLYAPGETVGRELD